MALSAKKIASNAKWDKENMDYMALKVKKEKGADFRELCKRSGAPINTALHSYITACIDQDTLRPDMSSDTEQLP